MKTLKYNIPKDFKLRISKEYRDVDGFIAELNRTMLIDPDITQRKIEEHLKDDADRYLSWTIFLALIAICLAFVPMMVIPSIVFVVASLVMLYKFKNRVDFFDFNVSMMMSFTSMIIHAESNFEKEEE